MNIDMHTYNRKPLLVVPGSVWRSLETSVDVYLLNGRPDPDKFAALQAREPGLGTGWSKWYGEYTKELTEQRSAWLPLLQVSLIGIDAETLIGMLKQANPSVLMQRQVALPWGGTTFSWVRSQVHVDESAIRIGDKYIDFGDGFSISLSENTVTGTSPVFTAERTGYRY